MSVNIVTVLLHLVEEKANELMNLNPNDYTAKKQRRGQWKWREKNSTQEMSDFLVAEVSKDSCMSLLGDRFHQTFTGVSLSEEYGTWSHNFNAESKG